MGNQAWRLDPKVVDPESIQSYTIISGLAGVASVVAGVLVIKVIQRILDNQKDTIGRKMSEPVPPPEQELSA